MAESDLRLDGSFALGASWEEVLPEDAEEGPGASPLQLLAKDVPLASLDGVQSSNPLPPAFYSLH